MSGDGRGHGGDDESGELHDSELMVICSVLIDQE
jgi:hypothetical protein